ncbi:MAG: polyprenyl synthetase family protein [Bacteroidaceae bacterium]|nr:polyprenyl synthetase family protein [Bacteroidaceae bacterium]MBQ7527005.1 polyprenyl synthetase family protein [Bacteroidaceae bacterium]
MDVLDKIKAPVAAELEQFNDAFRKTLYSDNPLLEQAVEHLLKAPGKQLRPLLVLLSARMVAEVNDKVIQVALALEMLHTATLVHDDVVDESDRRRGLPSLNAFLSSQVAVLSGDFILSKALECAALTEDVRVVRHIAQLGQTLADGELLQLDSKDSDVLSEAAYFDVISRKTASLFSVCARLGALAAGGSEAEAERLAQFGKLIGICFQIRDDVFDYGTAEVGKPVGNDMREGKLTLPAIYVVNYSDNEDMRELALKVRRREATAKEIQDLIQFAEKEGGLEYAQWRMKDMQGMADGLIDDTRDPAITEALHQLASFVAERVF